MTQTQCRVYLDSDFYCSSDINTKSLFFARFFFIEKQQKTYNELGEMRGIFFNQNPVIIVFIFTVAVLVVHSSVSLCYCTLLGCH